MKIKSDEIFEVLIDGKGSHRLQLPGDAIETTPLDILSILLPQLLNILGRLRIFFW